jgi:GNAT superfamily N-acetyltransferase
VEIRDATPAEARLLTHELHVETEQRYAGDDTAPEPLAEGADIDDDELVPPHGRFVVVLDDDGSVVGGGAIRRRDDERAELKRMYVRPAARARGLSRLILGELEATAARSGYRALVLETGLRQPEAMRLYESSGYTRIPNYGYYKDSDLSVCYGKTLS